MTMFKPTLLILLTAFLLPVMTIFSLNQPDVVHAGPLAGFTPTPVPPPTQPGNTGDDDDDDSDAGEPRGGIVTIKINPCEIICTQATQHDPLSSFAALASVSDEALFLPLSAESQEIMASEIHVPVQLIHLGTGWISEGMLSNQKGTNFVLPYPGQWEVYQIGNPELIVTTDNEAQLLSEAAALSYRGTPKLLGKIEANIKGTQQVDCPFECEDEHPVISPALETLPQTGAEATAITLAQVLLRSGLILLGLGLVGLGVIRFKNRANLQS